jgi:hypothetical protein
MVSDRVWILQNGKAIDRSKYVYRKSIIKVNLDLFGLQEFQMALKIVDSYFKKHNTICREEKNDAKHRYKINLSILSKG